MKEELGIGPPKVLSQREALCKPNDLLNPPAELLVRQLIVCVGQSMSDEGSQLKSCRQLTSRMISI